MNKSNTPAKPNRSILIINGETADSVLLTDLLNSNGKSTDYSLQRARSCDHALKLLRRQTVSCCLLNYPSKYEDAIARVLSFLKSIRRRKLCENIAVIIIANEGECDARQAVEFIHQGAQDFLVREDITANRLLNNIDDAVYQCEFQKNLIHLAHYDHLTGLLNRGLFMDRLQHTVNQSTRNETTCSLLYIDVDNFKQVNDLYGHDVGDKLLLKVSEQIHRNCRNTDSAARIGGDEFAVVISSPATADANKLTAAIIKKIAADIRLESPDIEVSLSVGVAHYPNTAKDIDQLMKQADSAMYKAKRAGRSRYVEFSKNQYHQWERGHRLESMLPEAIINNELSLSFQPMYKPQSEELVCVLPQVHWSPSRYKVSSDELLTMIARLKLYESYYEWLLPESLVQLQYLHHHYNRKVGLVLPMERLNDEWLLQQLEQTRERYSGLNSAIYIALPETTLLQNPLQSRRLTKHLKSLGYTLLVTQFSASYESKALITTLPVDILQLDHRCIIDLDTQPDSRKMLEAAVLYAHRLGLSITIDNVKNHAIYRVALQAHCDQITGDYCPPLTMVKPSPCLNPQRVNAQ